MACLRTRRNSQLAIDRFSRFQAMPLMKAAFLNGIAWNLLNLSIASWLFLRVRKQAISR